jgi:2-keto-3-deoxy-L-rhamnonate aldolase RhmA
MAGSVVPENRLKRILRDGGTAVGTILAEFRQPSVMQLLAVAGFDFVIIDNEHGPFNIETIADLSRTARAAGVTPIVRPPELGYAHLTQALDGGAQGIMLPRVTGPADVHECLAMMKYPPIGRRGTVMARGHTDFRTGPLLEAMQRANAETMLVVQVETAQAVERLDEILGIPGVDVALVGPNDLSVALGVGGQMESPVLAEAIERTIAACRRHDVVPSIHTGDARLSAAWAGKGMRMVSNGTETGYLVAAARAAVEQVRDGWGRSR